MSWKDAFHEEVKSYCLEKYPAYFSAGIKKVVSVESETESSGYCETCWSEEEVTIINHYNDKDEFYSSTIYIPLSDFMSSLDD